MTKYKPVDPIKSPRFSGIRTFMRLPHTQKLENVDFAIIGVPSDAGASFRTGQREGPSAIRRTSALLRHHNPILKISPFEYLSGIDYGDLPVVPGYIEEGYKRIEESLFPIVDNGIIPILLGGDHAISLPELRAIAKKHGPVSLIHFDSHSDTIDEYFGMPYNHGTPFSRAIEEKLLLVDSSIQVGLRGSVYSSEHLEIPRKLGLEVLTTSDIKGMGLEETINAIKERVEGTKVFVSFDIDFVDPAYAPGTGTPEVGGFNSTETLKLVRGLEGLNFVGFDLVEVLPSFDPSEITSLLASNIIYEFISLLSINKRDGIF
ncbi:MAG: agmatinase [Candidatus Heimdallarchaeota archaeon]|nr:agmatinase [Candidatus Heimdallarchaeota archaeon]